MGAPPASNRGLGDWLLARPALPAVALFALGIALHAVVWHNVPFWLLALLALLLAAGMFIERPWRSAGALAAALVVAGIVAAQLAHFQFPSRDILHFSTAEPRLAEVELQLEQTPRLSADPARPHVPPHQSGRAKVTAVRTARGWQPADGEALFSFSQPAPRLLAGQRLRAAGTLERPAPAMNPGQFDAQRAYRRQRIGAALHVAHACDICLLPGGAESSIADVDAGVREWLALGFSPRQQVDRALLAALMLGDRDAELRPVERDFQKTGASHLLSSSGLRMAVLAGMLYFCCRLLSARPRVALTVVTLGVVAWGALTVPSAQGLRPIVVAIAVALGLARRRSTDSVQMLSLAAAVLLLLRPMDAYNPGFQFSFVIVLGMLVLTGPFTRFLEKIFLSGDEAALDHFQKLSPQRRVRAWLTRRLIEAASAAAVAWALSIPLVAYHFEQFTPWAVPIGLLLSPLVLAALGVGFIKLLLTMLLPGLAGHWAMMADIPLLLLRQAIHLAAKLPWADVPVASPPIAMVVAYYALLLAPLVPAAGRSAAWALRSAPLVACLLLLLLPGLIGLARGGRPTLRITLLSIGAGQCAVVEEPGGAAMMVDAGSSTLGDPLHECVEPFLRHEGHSRLEEIFLSHGDYDHISAAAGAFDECGVERIITTPFFRDHAKESHPCQDLLDLLDRAAHRPSEVCAGRTFDFGGGMAAQVLWPPAAAGFDSNNAGMVLRLTFGGRSILFPADIQDPAMRELLKNPAPLKSDILVAAHHGSSESLTGAFVAAVDPALIVSSDATRLTRKQRNFETLIGRRRLLRTGQTGAIEIDLCEDGRFVATTFRGGAVASPTRSSAR